MSIPDGVVRNEVGFMEALVKENRERGRCCSVEDALMMGEYHSVFVLVLVLVLVLSNGESTGSPWWVSAGADAKI